MKRAILFLVVFVLIGCGTYSGNVAALYWKRNISIEHWQENQHEDWSIPSGGVEVSRTSKAHGKHSCGDEYDYTDKKGKRHYKTKYCTTYDDWYTYRIWEWTPVRNLTTQADASVAPYWQEDYTLGENERVGPKSEEYHAIVHYNNDTCDVPISQAVWSALEIGESVKTDCRNNITN